MAKSSSAPAEQEMGFVAHLIELRDRLLRMVLAVGIVFLILMPFAQDLYSLLAEPLTRSVPKMIAYKVTSPFFIPYKLALLMAFVLALPYVLYQVWGFVTSLYQHEKKVITPLLVSSVALFYLGMAFAYFFVLPMIFTILPNFAPANVEVMPDIGEYLDFVMLMFMAFGIGFEMPVATILIISTGMMTRADLAKSRPYVVVAAFIVGMLLTPPDVLSQIMLAVPMWFLFEIGLVASRFFEKHLDLTRKKREEADAAERAAEEAEYEASYAAERAATAAAVMATASSVRAGDDVEVPQTNDSWEDNRYTYTENQPGSVMQDDYRPLSDDEMEAELARIEAEQAALDEQARYAAGLENTKPSLDKD